MNRSMQNGGWSPVRYGHRHHPRVVELCCPSCGAYACATNRHVPTGWVHFMDTVPFEKQWLVRCWTCTFRSTVDGEALCRETLYWRVEVLGLEVWAWNRRHLIMVLKRLKKQSLSGDPWAFFATYIPGSWLAKLDDSRAWKKLEQRLLEGR